MLLVSIVLAACAFVSQDPPAARGQVPEHLAHPKGYKAKPGVMYENLSIPRPMSIEEWEGYEKILILSDGQRRHLEVVYDQYRRLDWAFRVENTQQLFDRSAEIMAEGVNIMRPDMAAPRVALYQARDKVWPEILRIERTLFDDLASVLADSQLDALETVRLMRERSNHRRFDSRFPAFYFDLDEVLMALDEEGVDLTADDPQAFRQLVHAWRSAAGSLYAQHAEDAGRALREGVPLGAEWYAAREGGQDALAADLEAKYSRVSEPATRTARRIHDLHKSHVEMLALHLPAIARERLSKTFYCAAYKPFAPDPCDISALFAIAEAGDLSVHQRKSIAELHEGWRAADQVMLTRMLSDYLAWNEQTCTKNSYDRNDYPEYAKRMAASFESRVSGSNAAIEAVLENLPKQAQRALMKPVDKWRSAVDAFRAEQQKVQTRHGGWPAPFD